MDTPQNDYRAMLEERVDKMEVRLEMLEAFKAECVKHHMDNEDKHRRLEDPVNRNTESNLLLAEAITEINITMTKMAENMKNGQPVIDFWTNAGKAWRFNKMLWAALVGLAMGVAAIITVWKML